MSISNRHLTHFVRESDEIENIFNHKRHDAHFSALKWFLSQPVITVATLEEFVKRTEPKAHLRAPEDGPYGVGDYVAPGAVIARSRLDTLLTEVNEDKRDPWVVHVLYEKIHPFTDGNGRSGRALWLWQMVRQKGYDGRYRFLQEFYYRAFKLEHFTV